MPNGEIAVSVASSTGIVTASVTKEGSFNKGDTFTLQLSKQAAKTVTPSTSAQTAVAKGKYTTGAVKVAAKSTFYVVHGTFTAASASSYTINGLAFKPTNIRAARVGNRASGTVGVAYIDNSSICCFDTDDRVYFSSANKTTFAQGSVTITLDEVTFRYKLRYVIWG